MVYQVDWDTCRVPPDHLSHGFVFRSPLPKPRIKLGISARARTGGPARELRAPTRKATMCMPSIYPSPSHPSPLRDALQLVHR